jgi:excisionase family DNA binding protein
MRAAAAKVPTTEAAEQARLALRALSKVKSRKTGRTLLVPPAAGGPGVSVTVPREAFDLFLEILGQMADGNAVSILPVQAELTTQEAAEMLNVSRPHLIQLLEAGKIGFRRVGTHRRVRVSDILAYHQKDESDRKAALDELALEAQKLGLGY